LEGDLGKRTKSSGQYRRLRPTSVTVVLDDVAFDTKQTATRALTRYPAMDLLAQWKTVEGEILPLLADPYRITRRS
jgi:hypothetical protein